MTESRILTIDRSVPFDPSRFLKTEGWSVIWEDERSLALDKIDLDRLCFDSLIKEKEFSISSGTKFSRLKEVKDKTPLDATIMLNFIKQPEFILPYFKRVINRRTLRISFDGTFIKNIDSQNDMFSTIYLYWNGRKLDFGVRHFGFVYREDSPTAFYRLDQ